MKQHVLNKGEYVHQIFTHSIQCICFIVLASLADTTKTTRTASRLMLILSFFLTLASVLDSSMFHKTMTVPLVLPKMEGDCANVKNQSCNALHQRKLNSVSHI